MKVVVTGGSGNFGQAVVAELTAHGHTVHSLDRRPHPGGHKPSWSADLREPGALYEACQGADALVHLAAHQAPGLTSDCVTFNDNSSMTYNALKAAVMVLAFAALHGGDPLDVVLVNKVRRDYLELSPLGRDLAGDQGIGQILRLLRKTDGE